MIANPPPWPNGARCAVAFSFDVDADSVVHAAHRAGARDLPQALAHMRYDPFVGTPRLADMFARAGVPLTAFVPGWVIETYPAAIETLLKAGAEIGHHGHFHEWPSKQTRDDELATLRRGSEAIERFCGAKPKGYRAPYYGLSRATFDLLIEEGFSYDSSLFADDVPILLDNGRGRLIELPVPASVDDYNQYVSARAFDYLMKISPPSQALAVFREEFDAFREFGGLFVPVWHPAVSGRPAQALAIRSLIEHMQAKGDVWFATLAQVADHVRALESAGTWSPRIENTPFHIRNILE
ncbi:peptidoglycan/xylan/chitin deacetylase (PgdA/CDA1 family) [Ancylobacter sp. 3268]|uniref:polysaccharide deacetylase family protein n=1 Tax=Ancylobacter sp. 3268 TaxID=2817752 RepID=UPI002864F123|nr:polysaccharide deacetylase [Ancylobacter sp. 3268]MDR6950980.1 peptidoglycan/xylan/chitin deacetylase (PgdA/CDA1 family) [Ancylobacter sp. 3268]